MPVRRTLLIVLMVVGCGQGGDASSTPGAACESSRGVTLELRSPLPAALAAGCGADAQELGTVLIGIYDEGGCTLTIEGDVVVGCCRDVADHNTYQATLIYRRQLVPLAEQSLQLTVPLGASSPLTVSFAAVPLARPYDTDGDGVDNVREWCAGTL